MTAKGMNIIRVFLVALIFTIFLGVRAETVLSDDADSVTKGSTVAISHTRCELTGRGVRLQNSRLIKFQLEVCSLSSGSQEVARFYREKLNAVLNYKALSMQPNSVDAFFTAKPPASYDKGARLWYLIEQLTSHEIQCGLRITLGINESSQNAIHSLSHDCQF